jgi:hypothetical protein
MTTTAKSTIATDNDSYAAFVLAQLECAGLRARLLVADIDSAAVALRGGFIDPDTAMEWMGEIGGLGVMSATITSIST